MSATDPATPTPGWRRLSTAGVGVVAGVCGVVLVRTLVGARMVLVGALVGLVALSAGTSLSRASLLVNRLPVYSG